MVSSLRFHTLYIGIICALLFPFAVAQGTPKTLTPEEMRSAEEDFQKYRDDPAKRQQLTALAQMALGTFGYGTGPFDGVMDQKTKTAILVYQKTRGLRQSGEIDHLTMINIFEDFELSRKSIPYLSSLNVYTDGWGEGYFKAAGTWVIEQNTMGNPIQTTEIQCYEPAKVCVEATAELGKDDFLFVSSANHRIERWDKYEIVTSPKEFGCVRYTMRVLREQKSVTASRIRTKIDGECNHAENELHLRLDDGFKIQRELQSKKAEAMKQFMQAPGLRQIIE